MAKIDLLSAAKVKAIKTPGDYLDGRGLYLQVRSETSKSWLLKYSINKRAREMGLGSAFDFGLSDAREMRDKYRKLLGQDIDPIQHRTAEQASRAAADAKVTTFKQATERYIAANLAGWKNPKHADQWRMTLLGTDPRGKPAKNDYCKPIRDLPIQSIDTTLVMKILDPIWSTKTETAGRIRGRIETVINSAKAHEEYVGENPARWKGHLENLLPKRSKIRGTRKKSHPALPYAELPAFVEDLRSREGIAAAALEFHILTAARPGNAVGARWSEMDRKEAAWNIRGDHMKGEIDHRVPLSAAALAVLDRMEKVRAGEFVFCSPDSKRPLSDAAMGAVIDRMCKIRKWIDPRSGRRIVPHGFRATFRTWGGEETNFAREILEKALAHVVGDETERSYDRGDLFDKRRALMEAWAAFATKDPARSANVLPFAPVATAT
jgi:integrase